MLASSAPPQRAVTTRRTPAFQRRLALTGLAFIAPFAILFVATLILPLAYAAWLSLYREQMVGGNTFVGLANYVRAFEDPVLRAGLGRVLVFMAIQIPIGLLIALGAAVAIDSRRLRAAGLFRLGMFVPFAVPTVVAALMWGYMYGPKFGLVGDVAQWLDVTPPNLLDRGWILPSMANITIWQGAGYNMLIFFSTLKSIPEELYEAAEIDGAGEFRKLISIKLPALRSTIGLTMFFSVIGAIQLFTEPSILQSLAPTVITSGFTPNLYSYNLAFAGNSYNYSAAVAVSLGLTTVMLAVAFQFFLGRSRRTQTGLGK